jgi:hypothetical protein
MFCPSCGNQIPDSSRYCLECGKSPTATITAAGKPIEREEPKRESHTLRNILLGLVVLLVFYLGAVLVSNGGLSAAARIGQHEPLISGSVVVKAGTIYYVRFTVDRSARVAGRFEAAGGGGNDIEAVIASSDEFENWQNGHQAHVLYQTEKTTVAILNVPIIQPGTYYLGFNKFSLVSDKTVTGDIVLYH